MPYTGIKEPASVVFNMLTMYSGYEPFVTYRKLSFSTNKLYFTNPIE